MKETEIIETLNDTEKEFYRLRYVEKLTLTEIADKIHYEIRTLSRIDKRIKSMLGNPKKIKKQKTDSNFKCKYCGCKIAGGDTCTNCREKARLWREFKARVRPYSRGCKLG